MNGATAKRRWFIPEVIQTSGMDCGPASLKAFLGGFNIYTSYGRLREACQTDVDGTSIDTLEEIAVQLGLDAEQIMLPEDHLLISAANALPAMVVVRIPTGATHFIIVWRRLGQLVQIMDPGTGRRWVHWRQLRKRLFIHAMPVSAGAWREWAGSDEFVMPLRQRMHKLGIDQKHQKKFIHQVLTQPQWHPIAKLDAALRLGQTLIEAKAIKRGSAVSDLIQHLLQEVEYSTDAIPATHWIVHPLPEGTQPQDGEEEQIVLRGVVIVRARGVLHTHENEKSVNTESELHKPLSPELIAALNSPHSRPGRRLWQALKEDGLLTPVSLIFGLALAAGGIMIEVLLFRGLLDIGQDLTLIEQRLLAAVALLIFGVGMLLLEWPIIKGALQLGRHLETRLRISFLKKLPRLNDRYFHSRPSSDMAERSHSIHAVRELPRCGKAFTQTAFALLFTTVGVIWLDPSITIWVILAAVMAVALPLLIQPLLNERELRKRSHEGALGQFYLDALIGLVAVRTHAAEASLREEHEGLLVQWAKSARSLLFVAVMAEALQLVMGFGLAAWVFAQHLQSSKSIGTVLLLAYWVLNIPQLGSTLALTARQYPTIRNRMLRLLEPLDAPEKTLSLTVHKDDYAEPPATQQGGVAITFDQVSVVVSGHLVLGNIHLTANAGEHIAIVGSSGAGKSTLVGLLLGWHRPAAGKVFVDDQILDDEQLRQLRRSTAWVDPSVQIWNRSLIDNLRYGAEDSAQIDLASVLSKTDLHQLLVGLEEGMQTALGEGGGLLSGGEGQRVRLARAMMRHETRLVIMDEPFRGMDRDLRAELLKRCRQNWQHATLLCITHDIAHTRDFDRVCVVEQGQIIEQGNPLELLRNSDSYFSTLLRVEQSLHNELWSDPSWIDLHIEAGQLKCSELERL